MIPKYNQPKVDHPVVPVSRADLAAMVGTAKETVNRVLSEFRQDELIMTEGKSITIINLRGLKQVVSMYN